MHDAAVSVIDATNPHPYANGKISVKLPWFGLWQTIIIYGGPFWKYRAQPGNYGICLTEDDRKGSNQHLPIVDFSVPELPRGYVQAVINEAIVAAVAGKHVYAGCLGGWGRTGLFLSVLLKSLGRPNPVEDVRAEYTPKAVETRAQYEYVMTHPFVLGKMQLLKLVLRGLKQRYFS